MTDHGVHPTSYKDPAGYVFQHDGIFYRKINNIYSQHYDLLMQSGLYTTLTEKKWLLPHTECEAGSFQSPDLYKILLPQQLSFISYAYEWSFDMLKDAALLTLKIARTALTYGMILKDATPFNIQFYNGAPVFIDTLSFEKHNQLTPWVAYRQFCETFLFPLYLEYYLNHDIKKILAVYINGIPVKVVAKMLPFKSKFNAGIWLHVHLQNAVKSGNKSDSANVNFSTAKFERLLSHLYNSIQQLEPGHGKPSTWSNYYQETILGPEYLEAKEKVFRSFLAAVSYKKVLDLGANDGYFSFILAEKASEVIAIDFDSQSINGLYNAVKNKKIGNLAPLVVDITNPSPAAGFNNEERPAFLDRIDPDLVVALALVHHLVISKNVPLALLAKWFARVSTMLIIEFVLPEDPKVQEMFAGMNATNTGYSLPAFELAFSESFQILKKEGIPGCLRVLYLMQARSPALKGG